MDVSNNVIKTLTRWCLVLQAIMISFNTVALKEPDYVNMNVTIRNAMTGLIRPEIVYRCQSKRKDYGWHRSTKPGTQFSFPIILIKGESKIPAIHICHVRSALGTATLVIENTYLDASLRCVLNHHVLMKRHQKGSCLEALNGISKPCFQNSNQLSI
ncbi:unnamed protein product [Eruca vesicaria subsp. sativa]|uniref:S-protein homolog n=1 Tax=Eruca vesicaria subsp. sativa TaxID=29727 RepID=A0ABC8KLH0_ERUVS|nr:unnamed protein product [Eruca vesicaria subsp. sativa]